MIAMALASDKADAAFADLVYADQELVDGVRRDRRCLPRLAAHAAAGGAARVPVPPGPAPPGLPAVRGRRARSVRHGVAAARTATLTSGHARANVRPPRRR